MSLFPTLGGCRLLVSVVTWLFLGAEGLPVWKRLAVKVMARVGWTKSVASSPMTRVGLGRSLH